MKKWILAPILSIGLSGVLYYYSSGVNSNKEFVSFEINNAQAVINQTNGEMDITLPTGTNLTHLTPVFVATGPNVTVIGQPQYSGISYQNFESNVPYVVHASDGSVKSYFAHVTTSAGNANAYFDMFSIDSNTNSGLSYGQISGQNITVTVPYNSNVESLPAFFKYVGKSVKVNGVKQINNQTTNNFTSPVIYNVYAKDGTSSNYTVTVNKATASSKNITSFSIITNNGIYPCQINSTNISCGIPDTIPLSNLIAQWSSTGSQVYIGATLQHSGLTVNDFSSPRTYIVTSGDGLTNKNYTVTVSNSNYVFLDVQNLAETIFDNTNYYVNFILHNNTSSTISNISDSLSIPQPFQWTLNSDQCNTMSLAANESCVVSGTLTVPKSYGEAAIKFYVNNGNGQIIADFDKIITAIPQITELESNLPNPQNYAAYTFKNVGHHRMFGTATVNGNSICFDSNNVGTIESYSDKWSTCAVELSKENNTLYIPAFPGVGGKILISMDNRIPDGPTPSVTATNPPETYYTKWQQVEYGGGLNSFSNPVLFNLNPTNVDFISVPVTISTVISGVIGVWNDNSYATQGILYGENIKTQTVLNTIKTGLSNIPNATPKSWPSLAQNTEDNSNILRILSPSDVFPFINDPTNQFYFDGSIYNQYIDDLWAYYTDTDGGNFFYSNDDPVASLVTPGAQCRLKCQVTSSDNIMHCVVFSGTCPTNGSTGTVDGAYSGQSAGFTKFTPLDFISAAGVNTATTFGLNGTYRSVTGENIVSGQSVGFMPFCSDTNFMFGEPNFAANMNIYYLTQYNCLPNYSSYTTSVLDHYSLQSSLYFGYYNYGYSDTLNQSGAEYSYNNQLYPFTIDVNYQ